MDRRSLLPLTIGATLAALVFLSHQFGLLDGLELSSFDLRYRIRGTSAPSAPIVLVSIDQDSFDELDLPWPWPRYHHAELIQKLAKAGAKIIAFDILFTDPRPDRRED